MILTVCYILGLCKEIFLRVGEVQYLHFYQYFVLPTLGPF